ncbi:MAG: alpha-amylase family protein [Bacteroidota bacterium]
MHRILFSFLVIVQLVHVSCVENKLPKVYLIKGDHVDSLEENAINDLKADLEKSIDNEVYVVSENKPAPEEGVILVLGTPESNDLMMKLLADSGNSLTGDNPGPRGGLWSKVSFPNGLKGIVLAGSDSQGLQYAVYDYATDILDIDPLSYWTGKEGAKKNLDDLFAFESRVIAPPRVPILCYFENDVDELANYRGKPLEYDWESYTAMIDALVRLRYNAIQLFDMLGRPEFYKRPEYKNRYPNYQLDVEYLDRMIDYAHSKGMKVQVDFALGYQLHPMEEDKANCWKLYKQNWIDAWRYYFEETPLAKTDIFILRPRHQVWDWEYESSCGEDKIAVFNEVFEVFDGLVDSYKPNAIKALICYSDGMEMYNNGFRPPKDWIVAWSDDGFGGFEYLPKSTDGYQFGTYMHAGFWLNHTVHDPYPEKVASKMKQMFSDYGATAYCMVNGQTFRPFMLNLEAYSKVCQNPESFQGEKFYKTWTARYFNEDLAADARKSMQFLHKAQQTGHIGYVQHLWEIREAIAYLSNKPIERPGKSPVPYAYARVENDFDHVTMVKTYLDSAMVEAKKGMSKDMGGEKVFYNSYIKVPVQIYADLIAFELKLHKMAKLKKTYEETASTAKIEEALEVLTDARKDLRTIYDNRLKGDGIPKWEGWYDPRNRRPNNGFPTVAMMDAIDSNLQNLLKKQHENK